MKLWPAVLGFVSMFGCGGAQVEDAASGAPPNIIVILADDLGYNDIGVYGSEIIETPHIDRLAADGVRLTDGYVAAAVCSPSRAGALHGALSASLRL